VGGSQLRTLRPRRAPGRPGGAVGSDETDHPGRRRLWSWRPTATSSVRATWSWRSHRCSPGTLTTSLGSHPGATSSPSGCRWLGHQVHGRLRRAVLAGRRSDGQVTDDVGPVQLTFTTRHHRGPRAPLGLPRGHPCPRAVPRDSRPAQGGGDGLSRHVSSGHAPAHRLTTSSCQWAAERWTGGCYGATLAPGTLSQFGPALRHPCGASTGRHRVGPRCGPGTWTAPSDRGERRCGRAPSLL